MAPENRANPPVPAKIQRPHLDRVYKRTRLFHLLDSVRERPLVWVAASAGAGKTSLVSSYLEARRVRHIWYRADARDADPATFFYYLRQAVQRVSPRHTDSLPVLTPEYQPGVDVFARNFFEQTWLQLRSPAMCVIDNYQDLPESAPIHEFLAEAVAALPAGMAILCISRAEAPPEFARVRAAQQLATIDGEALNLTTEEAAQIARLSSAAERTDSQVEQLNARARGWAAGLILLLERADESRTDSIAEVDEDVFDYFAAEIMRQSQPEVRAFLRQSALLPVMDGSSTAALTGNPHSDEILRDLARRNYFIARRRGATTSYEFHPLFREFLLSDLRREAGSDDLRALQRRAGIILAQIGEYDMAVTLLQTAEDHKSLAVLVLEQAPDLIAHGRHQTLTRWLDAVPASYRTRHPWLEYWNGLGCFPFDPLAARKRFEHAFDLFASTGDAAGSYLSWVGIADSFILLWDDFTEMNRWLQEYEHLRQTYPGFPSPEVGARVHTAMFGVLTYMQPQNPAIAESRAHVEELLYSAPDPDVRVKMANSLALHYAWTGAFRDMDRAVQLGQSIVHAGKVSPISRIQAAILRLMYAWISGEMDSANNLLEDALQIGERSGVHFLDAIAFAQAVYVHGIRGDLAAMGEALEKIHALLSPQRRLDVSHYYHQMGWYYSLRQDYAQALGNLRQSLELSEKLSAQVPIALGRIALAGVLIHTNEFEEAHTLLDQAVNFTRATSSRHIEFIAELTQAYAFLRQGLGSKCAAALRSALHMAAEEGFWAHSNWDPRIVGPLCAFALQEGIEPGYVRALIRKYHLRPETSLANPEAWPWPVRITTLGLFSLVIDDKPFMAEGKTQKKPLELLKAVIALGGRDVPEARLSDLLWPDADADRARQSLKVALHRLRKLIGVETVSVRDGCVGLNTRNVWVDLWAIESLLDEVEQAIHAGVSTAAYETLQHALGLYQGPFLAADDSSFVLVPRERLRDRILGVIGELGQGLRNHKACDEIIALYHTGLDIDPLTESFYQGLIHCYGCLKQPVEAMKVYSRCRDILQRELGLQPSARTESLIESVRPSNP